MQLGATPARRSAKASSLFRRLRADDAREIEKALMRGPSRLSFADVPSSDDQEQTTPIKPESKI